MILLILNKIIFKGQHKIKIKGVNKNPDSKFPACCYQFDKNALLEFLSLLRKAASDFAYDIAGNVCHDMLFIASY